MLIPKRLPLSIDGQSLAGLARDTADHRVVELRHLQDLGVIIHHLKTFDVCGCQAELAFCDGTFRIRALGNSGLDEARARRAIGEVEQPHAWRRVHEFALPERGLVELQPVRSQCIRPF